MSQREGHRVSVDRGPASIVVQVPSKVNWSKVVIDYPPGFAFNREVAAVFLDTIIERQQRLNPDDPQRFVNLKARYLRVVHRDYWKYLNWLINAGIVETDGHFIVGAKSFGYRIAPLFNGKVTVIVLTKKTTIKAVLRRHAIAKHHLESTKTPSPTAFLSDPLVQRPTRIETTTLINPHTGAGTYAFSAIRLLFPEPYLSASFHRKALLRLYQQESQKTLPRDENVESHLSSSSSSSLSHLLCLGYNYGEPIAAMRRVEATMDRIAPDLWRTMAHLYESLKETTLDPKWREDFPTIAKQLKWSTKTADKEFHKLEKTEVAFLRDKPRFTRSTTNGRLDTPLTNLPKPFRKFIRMRGSDDWQQLDIVTAQPYLLLRILHEREAEREIIERWAAVVCEGDIYQTLADEMGTDRQNAKPGWFEVLFSHNKSRSNAKLHFEQRFPEVAAYVNFEKRVHHRDLAIRLQTLESHVILERICRRLADHAVLTLTIHDSIIVPTNDADFANSIMCDELTSFVGYKPRIRRNGSDGK